MDKELELEAEKYYKENVEGEPLTYETPIHCFIAGATSKYVEKQKLEFAIEQLNKIQVNVFAAFAEFEVVKSASSLLVKQIKELEQKLLEL